MSGSLVKMFDVKKAEGDVSLPADVGRSNAMIFHAQRGIGRQSRPYPWELGRHGAPTEAPLSPPVYKGESLADVLKINPYHDGDGKFTTKDKSKIFSGKKLPTGKAKELTGDEAKRVIDAAHGKSSHGLEVDSGKILKDGKIVGEISEFNAVGGKLVDFEYRKPYYRLSGRATSREEALNRIDATIQAEELEKTLKVKNRAVYDGDKKIATAEKISGGWRVKHLDSGKTQEVMGQVGFTAYTASKLEIKHRTGYEPL